VHANHRYIPPFLRRQQAAAEASGKEAQSSKSCAGLPTDQAEGNERYGYCVAQGVRPSMEDAIDVSELDASPRTEFYAVYDGHNGTQAVEFVKRRLPSLLCSQCAPADSDMKQAMSEAFSETDKELLEEMQKQCHTSPPKDMDMSAGCVGCVALVGDARIHIANLGDCRAIMCRKGEFVQLTVDHRADEANAEERARLAELGVEVSCDGYLHGRIGVSRAFGDWVWSCKEKCRGLICHPDVTTAEVTEDTEFLLLACDGIFEKMTSKEAGQIVRRRLRTTGSAKAAAESLVTHCTKRDVSDNLSVLVVIFNLPPVEPERTAPRLRSSFKLQFDESVEPAVVAA